MADLMSHTSSQSAARATFARLADSLGRLLLLFAIGLFLLLPPRSLYVLSLGIICALCAGTIAPRWRLRPRTLAWLLAIALAEHVARFWFHPGTLLRAGLVGTISATLLAGVMRSKGRRWRLAYALAAFGCFAALGLWAYDLEMPFQERTGNRNGPVVFIGDSLVAGADPDRGQDDLFVAQLQRRFSTRLINSGSAGDLSKDTLARLDRDALALQPRLVVVLVGGNDMLDHVPRATLQRNLSQIVERLTEAQIDVVLIETPSGIIVDRYAGVYADVARANRVRLVGEGLLRYLFAFSGRYTIDGIHLNRSGHALVARRLEGLMRGKFQIK